MTNLRELRKRINSIKSTKKITSAMQMVASARLRQSQEAIISASYYAASLGRVFQRLTKIINLLEIEDVSRGLPPRCKLPLLISGREEDKRHLVIVFASSKGLCGGFNMNIAKKTLSFVEHLEEQGRTVRLICIGSKISELLHAKLSQKIVATFNTRPSAKDELFDAGEITTHLMSMFDKHVVDSCSVIFNHTLSSHAQETLISPLFPLRISSLLKPFAKERPWGFLFKDEKGEEIGIKRRTRSHMTRRNKQYKASRNMETGGASASSTFKPIYKTLQDRRISEQEEIHAPITDAKLLEYDFEPENPQEIMDALLPDVLKAIIFRTFLESVVSENEARMTAMQSATHNASDMIDTLTLVYNRTRQAKITNELTEIISAAETI